MNNLYRPACLASSYTPISKREHIKPREVMPSINHEWLEKANAEAQAQASMAPCNETEDSCPF